jgi:hypothetical protein
MTLQNTEKIMSLGSIDPSRYPKLQLYVSLSNSDGLLTPVLKNLCVVYTPATELAISPWAFTASSNYFPNNQPLDVSLDVFNLGDEPAQNVKVNFELQNGIVTDSLTIDTIFASSYKSVSQRINVSGLLGSQTLVTKVLLEPGVNDLIYENNATFFPFYLEMGVGVNEDILVKFDGKKIRDGDFVSAKPTIEIFIPNHIPFDQLGTIVLDNSEINRNDFQLAKTATSAGNGLEYKPILTDGDHRIVINSKTNSVLFSENFKVSNRSQILDVFNYPNPFSSKTQFTFRLTGVNLPDRCVISIFTIAGRKLKEIIIYPDKFDLNSVEWDGRDADGNELANGVYLYKIKAFGNEVVQSNVEKLLKLK